uniref:Uncharacterized protein n=1 Tax=Trypanosoma vivax (strain Y486) TaxID=1055687 RepID=G0U2D2_TRYVY|nr:hypothetical protein TVY486_0902570 [Trypanosoma vivax Y486]
MFERNPYLHCCACFFFLLFLSILYACVDMYLACILIHPYIFCLFVHFMYFKLIFAIVLLLIFYFFSLCNYILVRKVFLKCFLVFSLFFIFALFLLYIFCIF